MRRSPLFALVAASLPFVAEGHFGILGTSFNPDMSQHLLTADRLAHGEGSQLLRQGYPLGPHSIVVALNKGLGIGLVQGFSGLTVAVAVLAPLTALAAFASSHRCAARPAALLVGIPYMVASYFAQGDFKETMQALFVLAFVLSLREISSSRASWRALAAPLRPRRSDRRRQRLRLQLPGPDLARGDRDHLGRSGVRDRAGAALLRWQVGLGRGRPRPRPAASRDGPRRSAPTSLCPRCYSPSWSPPRSAA